MYKNWLRKGYGHWFSTVLGIKVCPYCGNQHVLSVSQDEENKKARYQLDHILNKSNYPHLAISLYNLIPSCASCNHAKSTGDFLDPYHESIDDKIEFSFVDEHDKPILRLDDKDTLSKGKIKIKDLIDDTCDDWDKVKNNKDKLCLEGIYEIHKDVVHELYWKKGVYDNKSHRNNIKKYLSKITTNSKIESDIDRFIYGNYIEEEDSHLRPHTKLTRDIIKYLKGVIVVPKNKHKSKIRIISKD